MHEYAHVCELEYEAMNVGVTCMCTVTLCDFMIHKVVHWNTRCAFHVLEFMGLFLCHMTLCHASMNLILY